jgi:hypothetical protein
MGVMREFNRTRSALLNALSATMAIIVWMRFLPCRALFLYHPID